MPLPAWPFYLLIPTFILLHLFVSPYTKVEESFNLQAIHDILIHGIPTENADQFLTSNYDHVSFPGSVPRTFAGALLLSGLSRPWVALLNSTTQLQLLVRGVLGLLNAFALIAFGRSVQRAFGTSAGIWYAMFQASQFHVVYYASRTLPNMFALVFSNLALRSLLNAYALPWNRQGVSRGYRLSLYLLTIAGIVFRSELAILVGTITLYLFVTQRISITGVIIPAGLGGLIIGLLCTVPLDSFFWQSFPLWPEWTGFYYNTIQGRSADWGISPWHYYFANALPRLLLNPTTYLFCIPVAVLNAATRRRSLDLLIPLLSFIGFYSLLPHKEWRFIIYVVPGLTAIAAVGASWIWTRRGKSLIYSALSLVLAASVLVSFSVSTAILGMSSLNYPGGEALNVLHNGIRHPPKQHFDVYFDNLACQTGVTRFLESHSRPQTIFDVLEAKNTIGNRTWAYDKTEDPTTLHDPMFWAKFDYVLAERPEKVIGSWAVVHVVYGFGGVRLLKPGEESGSPMEPLYNNNGKVAVDEGWAWKVANVWRGLEELLRDSVLRGNWAEIRMEPRIRILQNQMK
ncbi:glycosyltransferase family 22 protein [Cucurbitaria berberidis CBS 394.84]|uniref:Mannosyltransferase n=1 Tax=Cucurbitaria berberidis CBS 394.84 TaxID=1168544 RepID=A0A9P4G741_9PLEO|nr:glycosyltransferase family 22 protein [Cucurbitaria berberidis CBS 394.84]KAF1839949.1 glycosyltransferase family 22 protein [Cucurbitaria berberidis CBS 394.84]